MNIVNLVGRVGLDPEIRYMEKDRVLAKVKLATQEHFEHSPQWHTVVFWGQTAIIAEKYLKKGSLVGILGRITYRYYEKEGNKFLACEIVGERLELLTPKETAQADNRDLYSSQVKNQGTAPGQPVLDGLQATDDTEDLPF